MASNDEPERMASDLTPEGLAADEESDEVLEIEDLEAEDDTESEDVPEEDAEAEQLPSEPDVSEVDPGSGKGETGPVILAGFWVRLGEFEGVDERYVGHVATIQRSPWEPAPIGVPHSGIAGYIYDEENENFVVRTRDSADALLEVPVEAFTEWGQARVDLENHG